MFGFVLLVGVPFERLHVRSIAHGLERLSLLMLVGGVIAVPHPGDTGLSDSVCAGRWPAINGVLFAASAGAFALRLRRFRQAGRTDESRSDPGHGGTP
ncbi:hypothetical protein [Streptomyces sp. NPDC054834]